MTTTPTPTVRPPGRRGYLAPTLVRRVAFWTITLCVITSVSASILAIWEYTVTEVLWRTVATCVVVAAGTGVFALLNQWFGDVK